MSLWIHLSLFSFTAKIIEKFHLGAIFSYFIQLYAQKCVPQHDNYGLNQIVCFHFLTISEKTATLFPFTLLNYTQCGIITCY